MRRNKEDSLIIFKAEFSNNKNTNKENKNKKILFEIKKNSGVHLKYLNYNTDH